MDMIHLKTTVPARFWHKQGNKISSKGWTQEGFVWETDLRLFGDGPSPASVYNKKPHEEFVSAITYVRRSTTGSLYRKEIGFIKRGNLYHLVGDLSVDGGRVPKHTLNDEGLLTIPYYSFLPEARNQFLSILTECIELGADLIPEESI